MEDLIYKYLRQTLSQREWEELLEWLDEPKNKAKFQKYVQVDYYLNMDRVHQMNSTMDSLSKLQQELERPRTKVHRIWLGPVRLAAASIALLIGFAIGYHFMSKGPDLEEQIVDSVIEQGGGKATLTLESGEEVELGKGSRYNTAYVKSDGEEIVYGEQGQKSGLAYNYLTVPRGGQFTLTMSDGTKVWLNSDSKLKYPIAFVPDRVREVELVYGEAYFDVTPSQENGGMGFKVVHHDHYINVLGTEFNIKAYSNEQDIVTTLVEGKVAIKYQEDTTTLFPDQQSMVNIDSNTLTVSTVDAQSETAWRKGLFMFRDKTLKEIMIVMERWYDVEIKISNKNLENIKFKGTLSKDQSLHQILDLIRNTKFINDYEIKDKKVNIM